MNKKNNSRVIKSKNYQWTGIEKFAYKTDGSLFKDISRYSLLGEGETEQELNFQTRYFEIEPDGYSSLEYHRHPHSVIILRGKGSLVLGNELHSIHQHDLIFIAPETLHQFHADENDYLGFICIVDRYRDKPTVPNKEYLSTHISNPEVLSKIKF